ncbi:MAG: hypothetical protein A2176_12210 [Spirochaetes bacterium RBG_13_51_14]|nr:MAG: hypothetical protein A2176_12210 [Spirochaetes bacterium RBG_13_51_14]
MVSIKNISFEYKSTALFGSAALILSFFTGFLAGIKWNIVLLRAVILTVLFAGIGYGICVILKKFVPEVYDFLAAIASMSIGKEAEDLYMDTQAGSMKTAADEEAKPSTSASEDLPEAGPSDEFSELDKESLTQYSSAPGVGGSINTGAGKLGKHILAKEKMARYEPKIMAKAVRTMMSKDRE